MDIDLSDSPMGSPLSSHGSSEFGDEIRHEEHSAIEDLGEQADTPRMPPAKRQRTGQFSYRATPVDTTYDPGEISSDTEGSVPNSPWQSGIVQEDDREIHEQVTICKWVDCDAGDLLNMDALVQHIQEDHIGIRQRKYSCEWEGCSRKGSNHASGYALRAHMRSHTRQKPFFCTLPECDKSFTRSDALAKHMRTVHETESLRPSDPVPRNYSGAGVKTKNIKLKLNCKPRPPETEQAEGEVEVDDDATIVSPVSSEPEAPLSPFTYPADVEFSEEELALPLDHLYKLLRRQIGWAEEVGVILKKEVEELEGKHKREWQAKELVLANLSEAELAVAADNEDPDRLQLLTEDLPLPILPMKGPIPWYREQSVASAGARAKSVEIEGPVIDMD